MLTVQVQKHVNLLGVNFLVTRNLDSSFVVNFCPKQVNFITVFTRATRSIARYMLRRRGWLGGWVAGWLSVTPVIVSKRLNLFRNFFDHGSPVI